MLNERSVTEVARNFSEYINRVAHGGERFLLMRGRRPVAELRPVPRGRRLAELPEILRNLPRLEPGDAERFAADLEAAREELANLPETDHWES